MITMDEAVARAEEIVAAAWLVLDPSQRALLESIHAAQTQVSCEPLGRVADALLASAGSRPLPPAVRVSHDQALGLWVPELRVTLINAKHPKFSGLDRRSFEAAISDVVWHEWGHALSLHRADADDVARGEQLLALAPPGIAENIRSGSYRHREVTHELVANLFALLLARRKAGGEGKPDWLEEQLWNLVTKMTR